LLQSESFVLWRLFCYLSQPNNVGEDSREAGSLLNNILAAKPDLSSTTRWHSWTFEPSQGPLKSARDAGNSRVGVYDSDDASVRVDVCVWGHAAAAKTGRDKLARLGKQQRRGSRQLVAIVAIVSQSKAGARRKDADDVALVRRRRLGPRLGKEAGGT
jgi:hypothetical protein